MAMKKYDVTHIDFSDLRNQKRELLKVIRERNQPDGEDDLDGIVHMIDSIQDFVCDVLGYKEHDVFDLDMDDPDYHPETVCLEKYYEGKTKHVWICPNCGSDNVEVKHWYNPNIKEIGVACEDDEGWCGDCEEHCDLSYVELKFLSKIIGYQVRGGDLGDSVGRLHPDMASPTSVYNLGQANEVLRYSKRKSDAYWSLSTVWSGDIENPMMMFEGDIRGDNKELL